jgi:hypothetical protein
MDEIEVNNKLLDFYNSYKATPAAIAYFNSGGQEPYKEQMKRLLPYLSPGNMVFAGCNIGYDVWAMKQLGHEAHGFDISSDAISKAICSDCICCTVKKTPYKDKQFSNIILLDVLEHIPMEYLDDSLKECERICSKTLVARIPYVDGLLFENRGIESMIKNNTIYEHTIDASPDWWIEKISQFFTKENGWKYEYSDWSKDILDDGRNSRAILYIFKKE